MILKAFPETRKSYARNRGIITSTARASSIILVMNIAPMLLRNDFLPEITDHSGVKEVLFSAQSSVSRTAAAYLSGAARSFPVIVRIRITERRIPEEPLKSEKGSVSVK